MAHSIASVPEFWKKHEIGEALFAQPLGQPLAFRNPVEVGGVPELVGLLGDRLDQMRMGMAERVDRDAGGEIQIALTGRRHQPRALAPLESEVDAGIGRQQMRAHDRDLSSSVLAYAQFLSCAEMNRAASAGGT